MNEEKLYIVKVSKGIVTYEVYAHNEEQALNIADEWYNERKFEICELDNDEE